MRAFLLAATMILAPSARAGESEYARWQALKQADAAASREYYAYFQSRGLMNEQDMAQLHKLLFLDIQPTLQGAEDGQKRRAEMLLGAINVKNALDELDDATAADLKDRTSRLLQARLYYLYANLWPRIMVEGFEDAGLPAGPRAVLGSRVDVRMSEEEYRAVREKLRFDARAYDLPGEFFEDRKGDPL